MLRLSRSLLRPAGIVSVQVPLQMHPSDRLCTVAVLGSNQQQAPTPVSVALRSTRNLEALKVVIQATEDDVQPRELVDIAKHASQLFERSAKDSWQNVLLADITGGLCSLANKHLPQLSAKDTSSLLVLLAGLRCTDLALLQQLAEAMRPALGTNPTLPATQITSILVSMAQLGMRPSNAWLGAVLASLEFQLDRLTASELSAVLSAFARLGTRPTRPWMAMHEAALSVHASSLTAHELVAVVSACGELRHQPRPQLMTVLLERSQVALVLTYQTQEASGFDSESELQREGHEAAEGLDTQQLVQLVTGLTQLQCKPSQRWQDAFWQAFAVHLPQLCSVDLASMLSACRVLNMPAPHTYAQPLLAATQVSLKQLPPRSLPALLSDLQIVLPIHFSRGPSSADPRVGAWVGEYLQQCQDKLALLTAAGVVDVLAAVSCSGVVPSTAWMSAFAGAAVSKAGVLGPASLARLVTSLARLNQRPQHKLLAAFASSSVGKLGLLELNELSACGSALADLQFVPPPAWSQAFLSATHTQLRQLAMQAQSGERSGSEGSGSESSFVMQGSSTVSLRQSGATIQSAGARASYGSTAGPATIDASSRPLGSAVDAGGPSTIDSLSELLCAAAKLPLQLRDDWLEDFMLASQPLLQHARPAARAKLLWASVVLDLPGQTRGSLMHSLGRAFVQLLLADAQIGSLQGAQGADQKSKSEKKQTAQQQPRKQSTKQSGRQGRAPAQHGAQRTGVSPRQVPEPLVPCGAFLATSTSVPSPPWIETPGTVRSSSSKSSSPLLPAAAAPLVLRPHRFKMRQRAQPGE